MVTGTNTDFVSNVRIGDAFIGPDGRSYEVSNVASPTVLAIIPSYQGPTVSDATYSIMPVQGYQKDLADQVRGIVNAFGAKLATLGTTGNYDILPVTKGGTGATSTSTAQSALGLVPMAHPTDPTPGKLIGVGNWGLGAPIVLNNPGLNDVLTFGYYYVNLGLVTPSGYVSGWLFVLPINTDYVIQDFVTESDGSRHSRTKIAGVWQPWTRVLTSGPNGLSVTQGGTGNTTGTAPKLAASAILGGVSTASGIPTGAIMEQGANAAGEYTKYADGRLICLARPVGSPAVAANATTLLGPYALPASFADGNFITLASGIPVTNYDQYGFTYGYASSASTVTLVYRNGTVPQQIANIKILCVGRWY
jgi:hypothetical protein